MTETESLEQARDRVGCVHPLSRKLVKQSQTVQSAMYSCDTVITTKVLAPAVHSQLGLSPLQSINYLQKTSVDETLYFNATNLHILTWETFG